MTPQPPPAGNRSDRPRTQTSRGASRSSDETAFTIVELASVLAALVLLCTLALPALANGKGRSQQIVCLNNLSQIGRALMIWGADHRDRPPLMTPWWEGGTVWPHGETSPPGTGAAPGWFAGGLYNHIWFQFWWVSNELSSPKILACPADGDRRPASDFSTDPSGGLANPNFQNRAVTYGLNHPSLQSGRLPLSIERSVSHNAFGAGGTCAYGYLPNATLAGEQNQVWGDRIHPRSGNVLFTDGSVEQTDDRGVSEAVSKAYAIEGTPHYLFADWYGFQPAKWNPL